MSKPKPVLISIKGGCAYVEAGDGLVEIRDYDNADEEFTIEVIERARQETVLHKAAPDLLAALQVFIDRYDSAPDGTLGLGLVNRDFERARAAIAKAKAPL